MIAETRERRSVGRRTAPPQSPRAGRERALERREIALIDLIDRLLDGGVVINGDITLAVADVDLLYVGLRALVASVDTMERDLGVSLTRRGSRGTRS